METATTYADTINGIGNGGGRGDAENSRFGRINEKIGSMVLFQEVNRVAEENGVSLIGAANIMRDAAAANRAPVQQEQELSASNDQAAAQTNPFAALVAGHQDIATLAAYNMGSIRDHTNAPDVRSKSNGVILSA